MEGKSGEPRDVDPDQQDSRVHDEVVFTCGPSAHLHAVAAEMARDKLGSAVIVDPEHPLKVLGVFTTTDALRALSQFAPQEGP